MYYGFHRPRHPLAAQCLRAIMTDLAGFGINANHLCTRISSLDNDDQFSTASVETTATTISLSTPALLVTVPKAKPKSKETEEPKTPKPTPICRNLMRNPSMFGPELPCPQATPSPPLHIPLSAPIGYTLCLP
ncbi:hypothetical protein BDR03DRAFT_560064 [Suillus americanus]|nr:hypothetical protein BDR03DRAFT_560064 [Suillus americanus]